MKLGVLFALAAAVAVGAADAPLHVFDNGLGRGTATIEEQNGGDLRNSARLRK